MPNSFESALIMFLGRVPQRLGYATDGRTWMLTDAIAPLKRTQHQVFYYLNLVKTLSTTVEHPSIEIEATPEEKSNAENLLVAEKIRPDTPYMVLNPRTAYGSAKH